MSYHAERTRADRLAKKVAKLKQAIRDANEAVDERAGAGLEYFVNYEPFVRSRDVIRSVLQEKSDG